MTPENFLLMTANMLPRKHIYNDTLNNYQYVCDAKRWTQLTDSNWHVTRIYTDPTTWDLDVLDTDWYTNPATDLATVQYLSFS